MGKHEKERAVMHWLRCYVKGHRLTLVLPLVAVVYVISALSGGVPLPLPPIFSSFAPPVTIDSVLALMITAAIGLYTTSALSYFECSSLLPWWCADAVVLIALTSPSMLIWGISTEESLLARNLAVYLALFFLLTAFCGMNTTIVSLAVWMIGQSALYDPESGLLLWALTIILQEASSTQIATASLGAAVAWVVLRTRIKQSAYV